MTLMLAVIGVVVILALVALILSGRRTQPTAPLSRARHGAYVVEQGAAPETPAVPASAAPASPSPSPSPQEMLPPSLARFHLITVEDLSPGRRAELLSLLSRIPMPPRSLGKLMSPEFLASGASRELADFILHEPMLAAKVLARVNSPYYGLQSPIVSVQHAITFLGMNAVRSMALKLMLEDALQAGNPALQQLYGRIWDSGMLAAELCLLLSQKLGFTDTGASSTQTVLSFLGDFAVLRMLPFDAAAASWEHRLLERTRAQQEALGFNAAVAGSLLMREWGLPEGIVDGVGKIASLLVTPAPEKLTPQTLRFALCYVCGRIGEAIAMGRVSQPEQVSLASAHAPEYFHVLGYLRRPEFARLGDHLQAPDTRLALARMIAAGGVQAGAAGEIPSGRVGR